MRHHALPLVKIQCPLETLSQCKDGSAPHNLFLCRGMIETLPSHTCYPDLTGGTILKLELCSRSWRARAPVQRKTTFGRVSGPTYWEEAIARAECLMQQSKNVAKVTCWHITCEIVDSGIYNCRTYISRTRACYADVSELCFAAARMCCLSVAICRH